MSAQLYSQHYIGTGEQTKMFTLRHQYEEKVFFNVGDGKAQSAIVMRDYYVQNLSTDSEKAVERAKELGFEVKTPKFTLQEIVKRDGELAEEARLAAEEKFAATQKAKLDYELKLVKEHRFPFGFNEGVSFEYMVTKKGHGWAGYWMKSGRASDATATIKLMGLVLEGLYPEVARVTFLNDKGNGKFFGEVGVRQQKVKVTNVASYGYDGYYSYVHIEKFLTETGELLTYMGSAYLEISKGDELVISFGIKEHEVYEGEHQTIIQRVKIN
jgi:hypothetical protein